MADEVHLTKHGIQVLGWDGEVGQYVERKIPTALEVLRCACHIDAAVTLGDIFRAVVQDPELVNFRQRAFGAMPTRSIWRLIIPSAGNSISSIS